MRRIFAIAVAFGLPLLMWGLFGTNYGHLTAVDSDDVIAYDLADTNDLRRMGLSNRPVLSDSHGMLFALEQPSIPSFWMKEMRFPLDIVWIRPNKTVVGVSTAVQPESYPETVSPTESVLYVLEVNAGRAAELGIVPGAVLEF